jgi:hypothetical protein
LVLLVVTGLRRKLLYRLPSIVRVECGDGLGYIRGIFPEMQ